MFDVNREEDPCPDNDSVYRFFPKHVNLAPSRISSFSLEVGTGLPGSSVHDVNAKLTNKDGGAVSSSDGGKDLVGLFSFGLFGDAGTDPEDAKHPYSGYYDPTARASFTMPVEDDSSAIIASDVSDDAAQLYGGTRQSWIPKAWSPCGHTYAIATDLDGDGEAPVVADWNGMAWVTRLICGGNGGTIHTDLLSNGLALETDCRSNTDVPFVLLSLDTLAIWETDGRFEDVDIEDLSNVNDNTHIKVGPGFKGDTITIRIALKGTQITPSSLYRLTQ